MKGLIFRWLLTIGLLIYLLNFSDSILLYWASGILFGMGIGDTIVKITLRDLG